MIVLLLVTFVSNAVVVHTSVCFSEPFQTWSQWSSCSKSCGGGFRMRNCLGDGTHDTERCNAICFSGADFYDSQCHCRAGTTGGCCEDIRECASYPCKNGGQCIEQINSYSCHCPAGTTGTHCDDISECASHPCQNNGTCHEHINYYSCTCPVGTTGHNCIDILECQSNPCQNGGTCLEHINSYSCICPAGTTGHDCKDITECISHPCQHGGTCNEMINKYNCTCPPQYVGVNCEKDLLALHDSTCRKDFNCYAVFLVKDTWQGAQDFCAARRGNLVVPEDINEQLFLENYLDAMKDRFPELLFWIGGTKTGTEHPVWVNEIKSSVFRWPAGVSDHIDGTQCLILDGRYGFQWQTHNCSSHSFFICKERILFQII